MINLIIVNSFLFIIAIILIFNKHFLKTLDKTCNNTRIFIHKNESFFTILFLFFFFIQQFILVILVFYFKTNLNLLQVIISIFALIVITTASLQKIILDVRIRYFREKVDILINLIHNIPRKHKSKSS
tara:strand:- start:3624 stop:4007 length:384 start_codon:yes stop_codon:yes gene_type:complete